MTDVLDLYLKSKATKKTYRYVWNRLFLKQIGIAEKKLLGMNPKQQEQKIIDYVSFLKEENLAPTTIRLRLAVMEFVFSMNDIMLNWKKLRKMILKG